MLPFQFRNCEFEEFKNGFYLISFNSVDVMVNPEKTKFNATRLMKSINSNPNLRYSQWRKGKTAMILIDSKEMEQEVTGCRATNGKYLDWSIFYKFVYDVSPVQGTRWLNGDEHWDRPETEGYLYLVQPQDKLDTDVYKIGRTWNPKQRFKGYGADVNVIRIKKVDDMFAAEKVMIAYFNRKFKKAIRDGLGNGDEYFHIKSKKLALIAFMKAIQLYEEQ